MLESLLEVGSCLMDRGFMIFSHLYKLENNFANRYFLCRARFHVKYQVIRVLSDGSQLVKRRETSQAKRKDPGMSNKIKVRVVDCRVEGHGDIRLFTSLIDEKEYSERSLAILCHDRWEPEIEIELDLEFD